ncbi:thioesterase II family protein [Leptothoe sp. LEGE 181152]|uniref:Thioesterase n=1 Tax=Adonisia turfae CCMR0081 TaxID=2292702 RepID=A0A6M0RI44_9CYAN|nr:thioesterase II family protein [Adonisia turfae]MDV3347351.1 thioesterase II family protein [Leptothoe sp. LEGE 181152]NEZ55874.1 thioesterase [Adonisia turfae CCMR0081]
MLVPKNSWVTCPNPNTLASLRLFCFPYAGGSALSFRNWSEQLPTTIEVCPIELPGRGMRIKETPFTQMSLLVKELVQSLLPYLDKPFVFLGHSLGALVCFELTRCLRKIGAYTPTHLFVSGHCAPQLPFSVPPIHTLPDAEFIENLRRLHGTPEAALVNKELMQLLLPALRSDFAVFTTYTYQPEFPLKCPITAFGGLQDPVMSCEMLEAWKKQTSAAFSMQMIPGDHFFIHTAQSLLLQFLTQSLNSITDQMSCI